MQTPLVTAVKEKSQASPVENSEPTGNITLQQILALVLMGNPQLAVFSTEIRAREAEMIQASLLPNPVFSIEGEDLANSALRGLDGNIITSKLSQVILLGGKRVKRMIAAGLTRDLAGWDYEVKRIDVLTQAAKAFIAVLNAQEKIALTQEFIRFSEQIVNSVTKRVQAGKTSPVEETKAKVALSSVKIELALAEQKLRAAKKRLAATWGSTAPQFQKAIGQLQAISPIPPLEQLANLIDQNPDLARWTTELAQRQALIELEKSEAIPDLTISLGETYYANGAPHVLDIGAPAASAPHANALMAGISIPIPIFNRNQGGVREAQQHFTKARQAWRATQVQVVADLSTAYQQLAGAHAEVTILETEVLPGAKSAFKAATRGFRLGKFDFLSVLNAQQTLFDSKLQYLDALTEYHQAVAGVERLIGERLEVAASTDSPEG
ncbi:outer membrane efflux protein [Candidatus Nitrosoglobus terrae]|uniref:Outer membrane efflux protein n=2 Tax=Candidatus Nitrosoglobus terrae TaxID=1630141 RepID=A0A1Q2SNE2_9GAMM|nr:outer membrane efflux protein [Candidatus Nitrosoglobus terrae]